MSTTLQLDRSKTFFDQGIFVRKSTQVNKEVIFVAVTKIDSGTHRGLSWKPLSYDFNDSRFPRYGGGWEVVVFRNEDDTERKSVWVNLDRVLSNNITFKGWEKGEMPDMESVPSVDVD